jgi:type II secretory ATPase GspE/PulE/Tfp pilus assembly ATPase PilB-like protein
LEKYIMVPSRSNPAQPEISDQLTPTPSQASEVSSLPTEHMFRLIDSILPFEACLYYQFLPLALEGRHLKLGMVAPQDSSALSYVRHILAYLNCSLKTEQISAEVHQSLLSAYLNHIHKSSSPQTQASDDDYKLDQCEKPTLVLNDSQTSLGETREPLDDALPTTNSFQHENENSSQSPCTPAQTPLLPSDVPSSERREVHLALPTTGVTSVAKVSASAKVVPLIEVQALYLSRPIEFLGTLAPKQLLQELLGRVLIGGIGRLYFERQPDGGRILWSQDGVLQSVLDGLSLPVFQGVIIELKRLVKSPLLPVTQPKQVEIERRYQQENLLLRLRVMPGTHGEEATLQVLRGVALKFYQRQELEKLSQDALKLAQQLQRKLNEIRERAYRHPTQLEALPALNQIMRSLNKQLESLAQLPINQQSDDSAS